MARGSTVGCINASDLVDALHALGADRRRLLAAAGLAAADLEDPDGRLPSSRLLALLREAAKRLGDPLVGLHAAEKVRTRGPLFYLLLSTPRFGEALHLLERFARVSLDTQRIEMSVSEGEVSLSIDPGDPSVRADHQAVDYIVGAILGSVRRAVPGFKPSGVELAHRLVGERGEWERALGCPVRFEARRSVLRFPAAALERAPVAANRAVAAQIKRYNAALLARVTSEKIGDRTADVVRMLLLDGLRVDRTLVARRLGMSERTLKRRLNQEGTTFKTLRDGVRVETAQALLMNRELKVEAVARSIGFNGTAAFSKAFVRWSGCSPVRYRDRLTHRGAVRRARPPGTAAGAGA
jgi:AraC-like DNA-binding protein